MWAFTVAECGLDHDKFWDLSWFEWSLYARRHKIKVRQVVEAEESAWARFRIQWSEFRNAHKGKAGKLVKPQDLLKLSFDNEEDQPKQVDMKKAIQQIGKTFKKDGVK